ncbi:MAG: hypothetical protein IRZ05_04400 [Micromonosporaceae bacterium]|nr:hypothetical protein [Micromonosporaceae bacterium]
MIDSLATAIIAASLVFTAWSLVGVVRDRPPDRVQFAGAALVELGLLIQESIAANRLVQGDRPEEVALFIGYLIASLVILPVGTWLGLLERTRWGTAIIGFAFLVIPVLVARLQQIWDGTVG